MNLPAKTTKILLFCVVFAVYNNDLFNKNFYAQQTFLFNIFNQKVSTSM